MLRTLGHVVLKGALYDGGYGGYPGYPAYKRRIELFLGNSGDVGVFCQGETMCADMLFGPVNVHQGESYRRGTAVRECTDLLLCSEHSES